MSQKKCTHAGCTKWASVGSIFCKDHSADQKSPAPVKKAKSHPHIDVIHPATVDGSLASFMGKTLGVKHSGKSMGLVKAPAIQDSEAVAYHQNKQANQAMAKAFASMVMATKNQDGSVKLPSKIIAEREAEKKKEGSVPKSKPVSTTKTEEDNDDDSPLEPPASEPPVIKKNPVLVNTKSEPVPSKKPVINTKTRSDSPPPGPPESPPPSSPSSAASSYVSDVASPVNKKKPASKPITSSSSSSSASSKSSSLPSSSAKPLPLEDDSDSDDSLTAIGHADEPLSPSSTEDSSMSYVSYEKLKKSAPLPDGVNPDERENYLSPSDFNKLFGMSKGEFSKLPKWKQLKLKEKVDLY
jgi:hypothetical protein